MPHSAVRNRSFCAYTTLAASFAVFAAPPASAQPVEGQASLPPCVSLGGNVLDASRMRPLTGATVALTRDSTENAAPRAACVSTTPPVRTVVTGDPGRYRFDGLPPGAYTVRVQRLGYTGAGRSGDAGLGQIDRNGGDIRAGGW